MVEIAVEGRERLPQSVAALWPRGVLDEVLGDQVERGVVTTLEGLVEGLHDLRGRHRAIPHDVGSRTRVVDVASETRGRQQPPTSRHASGASASAAAVTARAALPSVANCS